MSQQGARSLLLQQFLVLHQLGEHDSALVEVGVLGAHENQVATLSPRQAVPLAHHQGHVVKFVDLKCVQDQVHEVLVNVVHLNDEVSLVDSFILGVDWSLVQDALLLQLIELLAHVVGPQAQVEDDLLCDHVLHIRIVFLLVDEVDLLHGLLLLRGFRHD